MAKALTVRAVRLSDAEWKKLGKLARGQKVSTGRTVAMLIDRAPFSGDPEDVLLKAVGDWVESRGGRVIVSGGIQIQKFPGDGYYNFYVAVKCMGRKPEMAKEALANGRPKAKVKKQRGAK